MGPSSTAGDEGTNSGTQPIYDLSGHAEMHKTTTKLIVCFTHRPDAQRIAGRRCNVATSFKESIEEKIGGGGTLTGFTGESQLFPAVLTRNPTGQNSLTGDDRDDMDECYWKAVDEELVRVGVFA